DFINEKCASEGVCQSLRDVHYSNSTGDVQTKQMPVTETWDRIVEILKGAASCGKLEGYEENWIETVIRPLFSLSIDQLGLKDLLFIVNFESVRISPRTLLPLDGGTRVQVKRIDLILGLKPQEERANQAFARLRRDRRSLNQSLNSYNYSRPIALNVEVKRQAGVDPLVQLGIWSAAGFAKSAADGELHIAYQDADGRVILYSPTPIGRSDTLIGIFQILKALEVLNLWVLGEFREWFEEAVWGKLEQGLNSQRPDLMGETSARPP
ncbi:MAG: hypothetical protein M1840_002729, partial [Geoglossum simile]